MEPQHRGEWDDDFWVRETLADSQPWRSFGKEKHRVFVFFWFERRLAVSTIVHSRPSSVLNNVVYRHRYGITDLEPLPTFLSSFRVAWMELYLRRLVGSVDSG